MVGETDLKTISRALGKRGANAALHDFSIRELAVCSHLLLVGEIEASRHVVGDQAVHEIGAQRVETT